MYFFETEKLADSTSTADVVRALTERQQQGT